MPVDVIQSAFLGGGTVSGDLTIGTGVQLLLADGSAVVPPLSFTNETNMGFFRLSAGNMGWAQNGTIRINFSNNGIRIEDGDALGWSSSPGTAATNLSIERDADNVLAQRNGANAQESRLYNTFTNSTNYERVRFLWSGNEFSIEGQAAGTGTLRGINFGGSADLISFYGGTPLVLQTGVAVTDAAIHAALVALNLITA